MVNIHPARAGVNLVLVDFDDLDGYLPRMRGGQPVSFEPRPLRTQFSPHARGSTRRTIGTVLVLVILPARAGVNQHWNIVLPPANNLPCMRGGQPGSCKMSKGVLLFSPHARGSTLPQIAYYVATRIHPACAGINPDDSGSIQNQKDSPRTRGGQPHVQVQWLYDDAFTPHARGSI